jgi:glycosyltransferase involved in cell wall biosynthesis
MTETPLISIVIPVYNVEKYLRECLDSVVNQTMREIQIICVNDGSTDSSPAILEEYAQKDGRIEVIHKENGGLSSARNAAYPYLKGEYSLFVDSDDWIDLTLCEKVFRKTCETDAEIILFSYTSVGGGTKDYHCFTGINAEDKTHDEEKKTILGYPMAWGKIWKTDFLLKNHLLWPDGLYFEDNLVHWQGVLLAKKISVLPEELYYYRQREDSVTHKRSEAYFDLLMIYQRIETFLRENSYYLRYKDVFVAQKLGGIHYRYFLIKDELKQVFCQKAKEIIRAEEKRFIKNLPLNRLAFKLFYTDFTGDMELYRHTFWMLLKYFWRHPGKLIPWLRVRQLHRKTMASVCYEF